MIVIINGSLGVGKSSVAEHLHWMFQRSVHLDGDHIGAVHPFEIYDDARTLHLHRTMELLVRFHRENGYPNFVINYIFENSAQLRQLEGLLRPIDPDLHSFRLVCEPAEHEARVRRRARNSLEWELKRHVELTRIQDEAARAGNIGEPIDTTGLTAADVAHAVWMAIQKVNRE